MAEKMDRLGDLNLINASAVCSRETRTVLSGHSADSTMGLRVVKRDRD